MCFNCGDFIDLCFACGDPDGGPHARAKKFYVGDTFCEHMREKYGHETAEWRDRYGDEED